MTEQAPLVLGWRLKLALVAGYLGAAGVLVGAVIFAVKPLALLWLSTQNLPGFDVAVPSGETTDRTVTYAVGRLTVHTTPIESLVSVRWDPLVLDEQAMTLRLSEEARADGGTLAMTELRLRDQRVTVWHLSVGAEAWFSSVRCGGRQIAITTSGALRGAERLHQRIVKSLRCHPDPVGEANLGDVPVVLKLPPGYRRASAPVGELRFVSDRKEVTARSWAGHASPDEGARAIEESGVLGSDVHLGGREGKQFWFESAAPAHQQFGWVRSLDCPAWGGSVWLISISRISQVDAREGWEILRGARCRIAGERAPAWPQ
jgi:hypothetical protein